MGWVVERDEHGQPMRMHWETSRGVPYDEAANSIVKCIKCKMPGGWHLSDCPNLKRTTDSAESSPDK